GGHGAAASALERSAELSVDDGLRGQRLVAAAGAAWNAGKPERARALLAEAAPIVADGRSLADLDHLRGVIELGCGDLRHSCEILMAGAEAIAPLDPHRALEMLFDAANAGVDSGDYVRVAAAGQRAAELPRGEDDDMRFLADLLVGV